MVDAVSDPNLPPARSGERIEGSMIVLKATGETTGESFSMSETTIGAGFPGPPPHTHQHLHDMFYVLEGVLTMRLRDATHEVTAGSLVCVPPGIVHTFSNAGTTPVRFLNMNTPSGFEHARAGRSSDTRSTHARGDGADRVAIRLPPAGGFRGLTAGPRPFLRPVWIVQPSPRRKRQHRRVGPLAARPCCAASPACDIRAVVSRPVVRTGSDRVSRARISWLGG